MYTAAGSVAARLREGAGGEDRANMARPEDRLNHAPVLHGEAAVVRSDAKAQRAHEAAVAVGGLGPSGLLRGVQEAQVAVSPVRARVCNKGSQILVLVQPRCGRQRRQQHGLVRTLRRRRCY
jgi:hypothetical protein